MSQEIENLQDKMNWHWRNSMRTVRIFAFDARAALPMIILFFRLFDWRAWALVIAFFFFFRYLERKGLTFPAAIRRFRMWFVGVERPGLLSSQHKHFRDFT